MYKYYNMSQLTLPMETEILILENDIGQIGKMMNLNILIVRNLNLIDTLIVMIEMILKEISNYMNVILFRMPTTYQCMKHHSKSNKTILRNYNWEYLKSKINRQLSALETQISTVIEKLM